MTRFVTIAQGLQNIVVNKILVSVIIPVYKVEPYLRHCIDSVINQTYPNLEIILVDDGSPDNCPQICDEYARKDSRIKVIHKENGGLSDARNAGLDTCTGDYVFFIDSDDWISQNCIEILMKIAQKKNFDIVVSDFQKVYTIRDSKEKKIVHDYKEVTSFQAIENLLGPQGLTFTTSWGKLYKRELWTNLRYPKGKLYEDSYICYKLYAASKAIAFTSNPLYNYLQRNDSIMGKTKDPLHAIEPRILFYKFLKENFPSLQYVILSRLCWDYLFAYSQNSSNKDYLDKFYLYYKEYQSVNKPLSIRGTLLQLVALFPNLYVYYQRESPLRLRKK